MYNNLGIFENVTFMEEDVLNELKFFSPLKNELERLTKIKETDKNEYDGPKEVKEFVDKNYNDIKKCVNLLQDEPKELKKVSFLYLLSLILIWLIASTSLSAIAFFKIFNVIFLLLTSILQITSTFSRLYIDDKAVRKLEEIKKILVKLKKRNDLDEETINKIDKLIKGINKTARIPTNLLLNVPN